MNGYLLQALTFQWGTVAIGIGMWLALIMAFNVWFIWPNDKKVLGIVEANAIEKAKAHRVAQLAGRVNTMLSIPMLHCIVAQKNLGARPLRTRSSQSKSRDGTRAGQRRVQGVLCLAAAFDWIKS
jgi:hypothetical protein